MKQPARHVGRTLQFAEAIHLANSEKDSVLEACIQHRTVTQPYKAPL